MSMPELLGNQYLIEQIIATIEQAEYKSISFHDYMNMCLYQDGLGYYMKSDSKIGKDGDFYTSSSIGPFMGQMLAARFAQYMTEQISSEPFTITEWGSGTGKLALQILDELQLIYPTLYNNISYDIIEVSPYHQELQRDLLHSHIHKIRFIDAQSWWEMPALHHAIVFSNELLDAFPVHLVKKFNGQYQEVYVAYEQSSGQFIEVLHPIHEGDELAIYLNQYQINGSEGHRIEINLAADSWLRQMGSKLRTGLLVTIDYGDEASELYAEHRHMGTLMCYHKHLAHDNPYIHIGHQDITSHINFSSCMRIGNQSGFTNQVYQTQRQFLIDQGILSKLQDHAWGDPFHPVAKRNRAIRQLLIGDTMSELFKVLIQHREGD
ncbi:MAG: SAM-dependent methyltransferase [Paenibacillaceae bacterium]